MLFIKDMSKKSDASSPLDREPPGGAHIMIYSLVTKGNLLAFRLKTPTRDDVMRVTQRYMAKLNGSSLKIK